MFVVENDNCLDLCVEKYCSNPRTCMQEIEVNGFKILLELCEAHAEKLEGLILNKIIQRGINNG